GVVLILLTGILRSRLRPVVPPFGVFRSRKNGGPPGPPLKRFALRRVQLFDRRRLRIAEIPAKPAPNSERVTGSGTPPSSGTQPFGSVHTNCCWIAISSQAPPGASIFAIKLPKKSVCTNEPKSHMK